MNISKLAEALNKAAGEFDVGRLQEMRKRLRGLSRAPCKGIFGKKSIFENKGYAFHLGGRTELQFNIGEEEVNGKRVIRRGVAFSLETNKTLQTIEPLLPKLERFNDYLRAHPEDFPGMSMWHFDGAGTRSDDRPVSPIADALVVVDNFIALGRWTAVEKLGVLEILTDFDRLLPLYLHVESEGTPVVTPTGVPFVPGCPAFVESASVSVPARTMDVALRHKALQPVLYRLLAHEFGEENVRIEYLLDYGGSVDAAVRQGKDLLFFELKTAPDVRSCMRAALGQLLEYSCWWSSDRASELIVVGEHEVDGSAGEYLRTLRERFRLPVWYRCLDAEAGTLGPRL